MFSITERDQNASPAAKGGIVLLCSTIGALCLFSTPSKMLLLLEAGIFLTVALSLWFSDRTADPRPGFRAVALIPAVLFTLIGVHTFVMTLLGLEAPRGAVLALPVICGLGGFYAFYRLGCWMDERLCLLFEVSPEEPILSKWRANWFFPLCAVGYFFLEARNVWRTGYLYSVLAAFGIAAVVACRAPSLLARCRRDTWQWQAFCAFTAVGICWFQWENFLAAAGGQAIVGTLCAVAAFFFVYVCVCALFRGLRRCFRGIFSDVRPAEGWAYGVMVLLTLCFVTVTFLKTDAFYGTEYPYDIIYTSDSHTLVQENAYLWLTSGENDLRQPLFAVFAAPFLGAPYLLGKLLCLSPAWKALLMNYPQVLLLFLANFLLAKLLKLSGWRRVGFLLLTQLSYPALLFCLMMEQYLLAYFCLIWLLYLGCEKKTDAVAVGGAAGTLLTSAAMLPFLAKNHPRRNFAGWFREMRDSGIDFVIGILAFGRLEILLGAIDAALELKRFSGEGLPLWERLCQYTAFVPGCLLAPKAGVRENVWGNISWQLAESHTLHWAGLGILVLCLISVIWNRRKKLSILAGVWVAFSFLVLCVLGWGTQENGLILYAVYFGWAFWVLLYQLAERLEGLCRCPGLATGFWAAGVVGLAAVNIPAIVEMIRFAIAEYPL